MNATQMFLMRKQYLHQSLIIFYIEKMRQNILAMYQVLPSVVVRLLCWGWGQWQGTIHPGSNHYWSWRWWNSWTHSSTSWTTKHQEQQNSCWRSRWQHETKVYTNMFVIFSNNYQLPVTYIIWLFLYYLTFSVLLKI